MKSHFGCQYIWMKYATVLEAYTSLPNENWIGEYEQNTVTLISG
jgi:hypothetical protein